MFDKLVESEKQKQGKRARRLFFATGAIYAVALATLGVAAIVGFNSALAEEYDVTMRLIPPMPSGPAPQHAPRRQDLNQPAAPRFEPPKNIEPLPTLEDRKETDWQVKRGLIEGAPYIPSGDGKGFTPGAPDTDTPPPPPPTPAPVVKPTPAPTPVQVVKLTSMLTQGRVLRKVHPIYPAIARATKTQGQVQIQIGISETGAVTEV